MDKWKSRGGESQRGEEPKRERSEKRKSETKGAQKGRKVAKHCVFPMICGSGGWKKVGSLKRQVRSLWVDERSKIACS
jgi:hypothetical protein